VTQIPQAIHDAAARFAANAMESVQVGLDGSLKSLMFVMVVMQKYRTFYEGASAATIPTSRSSSSKSWSSPLAMSSKYS
jgi:hypothetical protein